MIDRYIIVDWANNQLDLGSFASYEAGWDFIYENISNENNSYDDLFVIKESLYKSNFSRIFN